MEAFQFLLITLHLESIKPKDTKEKLELHILKMKEIHLKIVEIMKHTKYFYLI